MAKTSGAALTEFFFLTIILVPLLFGTAMLGKQIDIAQRAVMASRYAVWETTVHGHGASADEVRHRFFAPSPGEDDSETDAADAERAGVTSRRGAEGDPDETGSAREDDAASGGILAQTRVAVRVDGVGARHEASDGSAVARTVGRAVNAAGDAIRRASGGEWDITADGMTRGVVSVPVESNGWLAGRTLEERSVIMNDGWNASGLNQLNARTKSFVPAGGLETVGNVLSNAGVLPVLKELKGLDGALGLVDASALPLPEVRPLQPYAERRP